MPAEKLTVSDEAYEVLGKKVCPENKRLRPPDLG